MDYLHNLILHRDRVSTLTHTHLGVSGHVPAQFIHHIIIIIHIICTIPSFLICFRFHVRVRTTTGMWYYYWVPPPALDVAGAGSRNSCALVSGPAGVALSCSLVQLCYQKAYSRAALFPVLSSSPATRSGSMLSGSRGAPASKIRAR